MTFGQAGELDTEHNTIVSQAEAQEAVGFYATVLTETYNARMAQKMGLREYDREVGAPAFISYLK